MDKDVSATSFFPDYEGLTGDKRLDARANALWGKLAQSPSSTISSLSESRAEQVAYYRLLENEKLSERALIEELVSRVAPLVKGRDVLCIQDSSEINVSGNKNRLQPNTGLGRSDNSENATCFKIHPGLVLDAVTFDPLGFSGIKIFHRPVEMPDRNQRRYKSLPLEEKESFKWVEVAEESKKVLTLAERVTYVQDREGDIFEQWARVPDQKSHLLIRSRTTRNLVGGPDLYTALGAQPVAGSFTIEIPADRRIDRAKRTGTMELRYGSFKIKCPANKKANGCPDFIELRCVSVREVTPNVKDPVHWRLLTTHELLCYEDAFKMVEWYRARWYVEQVFRLLKHKGFGIEDTLLETGWAIRKLLLMQLSALLKIMQMNIAYARPEGGQPIEEVFTQEEVQVLRLMNDRLQGRTAKTKNTNDPKKTRWATWVVGRIGGWKGYDSQGPPGVICLKKGLDRLEHLIQGVRLAKDMCTG
jgi:hypothetical protein